ncbi:hypothetical protein Q787_02890 [Ornithobacterium rhinotracheale H06-030791]|nr:hypothetical protein Q785_03040 [Ornithobacterium rhinotracheale ORT-UMN 88]KGB67220.1 hypothetical protein Q787_02890 [Ornithobacterium rhinotracheale H06-030791]
MFSFLKLIYLCKDTKKSQKLFCIYDLIFVNFWIY